MKIETKEFVIESEKQLPIYWEGDVVVAGAGISGSIAAIASGRYGARTILVDRFGSLGGNIGPAMIPAGTLYGEAEASLPGGLAGISKEFKERVEALDPFGPAHIPSQSFTASYVLEGMAREVGLELLLSAYASDPIVEGKRVCGLFVETCSGRVAIKAKVVVDATGEASIAARAGAAIIRHTPSDPSWGIMAGPPVNDPEYVFWNDTDILIVMAGVDYERFEKYNKEDIKLSPEDETWASQYWPKGFPGGLVPAARLAFKKSGFCIPGGINFPHYISCKIEKKVSSYISPFSHPGSGVVTMRLGAWGEINCDDAKQMSRIESFVRRLGYFFFHFLKENCPGFEKSFMVGTSSFFGMRGGPCIEGEHVLSVKEYGGTEGNRYGKKLFDDVIYRNILFARKWKFFDPSGFDVPYRCCLPKDIEGLLVAGRGVSFIRRGHDPSAMRSRASMMVLGQAVGTAAAMAAKKDITPGELKVKELQRELLKAGLNLGPEDRLKELGLS